MTKIENHTRLRERHTALLAEIEDLTRKHADAATQWQAAVVAGDAKLESNTAKALDAARTALESAQSRLPLVAAGLVQAEIDALPEQATLCADELADLNRRAYALGEELFKHYDAAQQCAAAIRALHEAHGTVMRGHLEKAKALRTPAPIPHDGRFVVNMAQMNHDLRSRFDQRFRMTAENIFDPHGLAAMDGAPDLDGAA